MISTGSKQKSLPGNPAVSSWTVAVYRKLENFQSSFQSYDTLRTQTPSSSAASFYIQLQFQCDSSSPKRSDVLNCRYSLPKNISTSQSLPFTINLINNFNYTPETSPTLTTNASSGTYSNSSSSANSSRFYNMEQSTARNTDYADSGPVLLFQAKAFLGILILNDTTNSINRMYSGPSLAFMIFVTEENHIGQLFDAHIYRISQVAAVSLRNNPEDENYVSGIKKLFQGRCFYYSSYAKAEASQQPNYFSIPYDITLCAQRMNQGHDSDLRFFWNRSLCLPLLRYNVDIRYWIPKVMCGGIERYRSQMDYIDLWLISRLSCERAGTRFNVRGVNDDGAVGNFVETEQIVVQYGQRNYSSFVMIRGSIPLFWQQPRFQVGTHRINLSRSEALSFRAFFEHFKYLYRKYGRVFILNLVEKRSQEGYIGDKYKNLFDLLVKTCRVTSKTPPVYGYLSERDFIWFDFHEQARTIRNLSPESFVQQMLIENAQYDLLPALTCQGTFTFVNGTTLDIQKGVFRVNCIDCLDRTNNVQLSIGLNVLLMQLESLKVRNRPSHLKDQLKEMWINNGDHISRIYTGTGALGQRSLAKDIQRSFGRAIQNNLRDDDKQQSMENFIFSYSRDSFLHERAASGLFTPYVFSDGSILKEIFNIRQRYVRKEKFRVSIGTWNINGDKNPALNDSYRPILDAWIFDGPENLVQNRRSERSIPTQGYLDRNYVKTMPHILAIGFQEICDLTASNLVSASSDNAKRWVQNVQDHFKRSHSNDKYILLENDQLVGVCLALFVRRELAPFIKNVAVESVKTALGGKLGNKGCVAIRFVLHNTSICFICAHFTAGQNEVNERNKDFKTIVEKLSFAPPSRAFWHDHIFFLGDFNYRLNTDRSKIFSYLRNGSYQELLQHDQLKNELKARKTFNEFVEGPIEFPPTYKYDINSDNYDSSEKARIPSYTDRILWRSLSDVARAELLYYGRAEVKTSDHRPVSALFDVEVEICDETSLRREYIAAGERFKPSNALVIFDMRASLNQQKAQIIKEVDLYCNQKYRQNVVIIERFFIENQDYLSLYIFFESGDQARNVMEPLEDQLPSGIYFRKRLVDSNDSIAIMIRLNSLFANHDETMFQETEIYDLGAYQMPENESLSSVQQMSATGIAINEDSLCLQNYGRHNQNANESSLISFDSDSISLTSSKSQPNFSQTPASTLMSSYSNPNQYSSQPSFETVPSEVNNLLSFEPVSETSTSKFYVDPFDMLYSSVNNSTSNQTTSHFVTPPTNGKNSQQFSNNTLPRMVPTRPAPPPPINVIPRSISTIQKPLTLENLNLNSNKNGKQNGNGNQNVMNGDLLDLGDPGSPPPSPKFDPLL